MIERIKILLVLFNLINGIKKNAFVLYKNKREENIFFVLNLNKRTDEKVRITPINTEIKTKKTFLIRFHMEYEDDGSPFLEYNENTY